MLVIQSIFTQAAPHSVSLQTTCYGVNALSAPGLLPEQVYKQGEGTGFGVVFCTAVVDFAHPYKLMRTLTFQAESLGSAFRTQFCGSACSLLQVGNFGGCSVCLNCRLSGGLDTGTHMHAFMLVCPP
jgi:hypothetical protein